MAESEKLDRKELPFCYKCASHCTLDDLQHVTNYLSNIQQVPKKFDRIWEVLNLHHVDGPANVFHEGHRKRKGNLIKLSIGIGFEKRL